MRKGVRINEREEKIASILGVVEKGCRERLFDQKRLKSGVERAENKLKQLGVPKKYWQGCIIVFKPEMVPNSYKGIAYGTEVEVKRGSKDWFITSAKRVQTGSQSYGKGEREILILDERAYSQIPVKYEL